MSRKTIRLVMAAVVFGGVAFALWRSFAVHEKPAPRALAPRTAPAEKRPEAPIIVQRSRYAMSTRFDCTLAVAEENDDTEAAIDAAFAEIDRIEALMTVYRKDSFLARVNAGAGRRAVAVPEEILRLVDDAKQISVLTEGKFDISFGAVGALWDFKSRPPKLPDPHALAKRLPLVDYRSILVDHAKGTLMLAKPGMSIGLGAIAKGYAVDRVSALLQKRGYDNFIINGGGDIYISGQKGDQPWQVGIQHPRDRSGYFARFPIKKSGAVVTSGDYEKFFDLDGKRYHHIMDPDTGYPATGTVSVTILAKTAERADALATGVFVLGPEKGMKLIEADDTLEGVIVNDKLVPLISSGLAGSMEVTPITEPKK